GLHSDESTFPEFHYSAVLYLSTQGDDFEGGTFSWSDPPEAAPPEGQPRRHVEPLRSGRRFAVPSFFTTLPGGPPAEATVPTEPRAVADELWRTLLAPQTAADPKEFFLKWHGLLAPGHA
ncbi:hypothetical protein EMIHUDRAFT_125340, partial [Emiliania huxleyi CCMP1516]|uniref:Fe2OG dioxygenase domain-containing protein n=2 Tax=Emiliania huxleyi TaxID=2903 RepID=A0A0D3I0K3_EMIH1